MNLARSYPRTACALCVLAVTSYITATFYVYNPALVLLVGGLPAIVAAWWLAVRHNFLLPRWVVNGLLFLAVLYALFRAVKGVTVEAVAELVVLIQVIKIGDRRGPRDDAQILSLAVFLAIAAMLTSNQFWVGVQLVLFIPLLIATVMLFQLHSGWLGAGGAPEPAGERPAVFRRTVAFASATTLALALFVFIIMPRGVGENVLGSWGKPDAQSRTAFTDHVQLGSSGIISTSSRVVLDLLVRDAAMDENEPGANMGNPEVLYYLRGAVLEPNPKAVGAWSPVPQDVGATDPRTTGNEILIVGHGPAPLRQDITIRNIDETKAAVFASWRPVKLRVPPVTSIAVEVDHHSGTIRRTGHGGQFDYTVWSAPVERGDEPAERTPVAYDCAPIHTLAVSILAAEGLEPDPGKREIADDARAARAIQDYLHRNFAYSLTERPAPAGADPVEHFLLNTREGHCEYFAAAMVALCRSVGVNARMVAGYVAAEYNTATGRYTVRESNAHAWVEAEAGKDRWRRFDPTPPAELVRIHRPKDGLLARLQRLLESIEYAWNAGIVGFDESARQRLFGPGSDSRPGLAGAIDGFARRIQNAGPRTFVRALIAGTAVFAGVASLGMILQHLLGVLLPFLARGPLKRFRIGEPMPRFYVDLLRELRARGLAKPHWRPPLDHAAALRAANPALADEVESLASLHYRGAFGARPPTRAELADARRRVRRLPRVPAA